jgi:hypothetical protein
MADPTGKGFPMKAPIVRLAFVGGLAASTAWAQYSSQPPSQVPSQSQAPPAANAQPESAVPPGGTGSSSAASEDTPVYPAASPLPALTPPDQLKAPTMLLPDEPIEPYLLTKENGPFMVWARTFRGLNAERMALALAKELRQEHHLLAYIVRTKDFPGRSLIRGTPPTAPSTLQQPQIKMPEKIRTRDEAAVLIGNEKTMADAAKLLDVVRKIHPKCLKNVSTPFPWRHGLSNAYRTVNPFAPAQTLYPRPPDKLIVQMNKGLRSLANCPGRYSLQVAEFTGRSAIQFGNQKLVTPLLPDLHESPLQTAAADAERLAERLAKSPEIQKLRQPVYVYHDRRSSKVFIGSFDSDRDPAAYEMREALLRVAVQLQNENPKPGLLQRDNSRGRTDIMIVPATGLTDLKDIKAQF